MIYRFSHVVWKAAWIFSSLKRENNRLTRHSQSGKHGRLGHAIEQQKCHAVARSEVYASSDFEARGSLLI